MAWITKNSAGLKVPRRSEPYLTDEMKAGLEREILPRYETRQGALLPTLHHVQEHWGWLPWQALEEIAGFLAMKPAEVWDTASFYEEFWLTPKGAHVVAVCRSIACEVCDHAAITKACTKALGIEVGETTDDGRFTLIELECLGLCEMAPCALMDHDAHGPLTPESMGRLIEEVRAKPDGHHGH
ncbi:MAG: NADH-quinone oxidoreductase subunit NuoE [Phycisphaerales bacterium]